MKSLKLLTALFAITSLTALHAQDTNEAGHAMEINISEVALLDIYDENEGSEAGTITFELDNSSITEAGLYDMSGATYTGLWLNYTSLIAEGKGNNSNNGNGKGKGKGKGKGGSSKDSRNISVQMEKNSEFPEGLDLVITSSQSSFVPNGGDADSRGEFVSGGVALGATTKIGKNITLIEGIKSVYTGDGAKGFQLTYTLNQTDNFSLVKAGNYTATLKYTLSEL
ncbi:hypothetical protein SAMN04487911_14412 [Arenibacter nanhaiticus]|uniref:Uncharacterized protein n=1 Tax=Arenibacter nanhaiticus TaxID=558155 RepID=A0A1M6MM71_9FLAO|nr:hypothetical protein [Arenibacter nanhaiticus]SHJ84514.1 hypothetical protein SAMN04487911_14412 [Arenibacter nanhaiticus]